MKNYIKLMRPKHYLKNALIFVPLVFSGSLFESNSLISCILAFLAFSFAASVVYIINDIKDKEKDAKHEIKKNRPIASGKVSIKKAIILAIVLIILSYLLNTIISKTLFDSRYLYIIGYVFLNILYSCGLKNIPLVDIVIIVIGFLIRVMYGAVVINVDVSNWLYLTIMAVSFYLGLGKRRNEIIKSGSKSREVLKYYNREFLDKNMYMCLALSIVFYALWAVDPAMVEKTNNLLIWTVPLIILLCMKYSMNIEQDSFGDPADVIFQDKPLLVLSAIYAIIMVLIIYLPNLM